MNQEVTNPNSTEYFEDGVDRIIRLMRDTFGDKFKKYFNGEAINPTPSELPAIMVTETKSNIDTNATGFDIVQEEIIIIVVLNMKDYAKASDDTVLPDYELRRLVQGQDPATKEYMPMTVLGAIRTHFTMDQDTLYSSVEVDFTPSLRGNKEQTINTWEAYVTITMQRLIPVPSRT